MGRLVFVLLALAVAYSSALDFHKKALQSVYSQLLERDPLKTSVGYDPVKCGEDLTESQSSTFVVCSTVIEHITDDFTYSDTEIAQFCNNQCSTKIVTLFHKIETDCGIDPGQLPAGALDLLPALCYNSTTPHHYTCLAEWKNWEEPSVFQDYASCVAQYSENAACPDICKTALTYAKDNIGCCYTTLENYAANDPVVQLAAHSVWATCGMKEPPACT